MRMQVHGIRSEAQARRALEEIERLLDDAARSGLTLDPWLSEVADELRAALPEVDAQGAQRIAARIAADPGLSLAAQSKLRAGTLRALKP